MGLCNIVKTIRVVKATEDVISFPRNIYVAKVAERINGLASQ